MTQSSHAASILAICRQPPYGKALGREGLEAVLAAAAMEQTPDLLFLGDGVFQLLDNQAPQSIEQKSLRRNLLALPMFDVEKIHACERSLQERGLTPEQVQLPGIELELLKNPGAFIARYQSVLSF